MNSKTIAYGILRAVAILAGVIGVLWLLYAIRSVLIYIIFAAVISLMGRRLVLFLKRKLKFGNTPAVLVTLIITIVLFLGIFSLFIPIIIKQSQYISTIDVNELKYELERLNIEISNYLNVEKLSLIEVLKRSDLMEILKPSLTL